MKAIVPIVIVAAMIGVLVYGIVSKRKREQVMADLAAQQGWTPLAHDAMTLAPYLPQYIQLLGQQDYGFSSGYAQIRTSYDMAYQAAIANHSVVFFQYEYTEYRQSGEAGQAVSHYFTVVYAAMPVAQPEILLLYHTFLSKLANFGLHNGLQKISLEGNFNDSYDTYIPEGSQIEALSVLTPDVMEDVMALAGSKKYASMQLGGPAIIMSFEDQPLTPQFILPLLQQAAVLLQKLDSKPHDTPAA